MTDLFTIKAPLFIRKANDSSEVIAELFPHPDGLIYFELNWHLGQPEETIHIINGELEGEGPWKIDGNVINILGCQGCDSTLALQYQDWQHYLQTASDEYPPKELIEAIVRKLSQ